MGFCIKCGKSNPETSKFCTGCGAVLTSAIPVAKETPKPSNLRWIILTALLVIVSGIASYFLFFNKKGNKNDTEQNIISTVEKGKYPQASDRLLTANDLENMSQAELRIMRNEIYARHGFIFKKEDMRQYFSVQPWYQPLFNNVDNLLSEIEKKILS
ncbi:MAG: YARHG domain-containing protein [Bacteroidetes bacterium]|nr:YARHG domain-containing protein [Bacteroidota bacterium]